MSHDMTLFNKCSRTDMTIPCDQIVSMPDLQIIDCAFGFTGSTHDATAWEHTQVYKKRDELFSTDEFIWADSVYPVRTFLMDLPKYPECI